MAIQLDGIDYTLDSPLDNALNLLNYINQYLTDNNITGSDGQVIQFYVNAASPMWLLILGLGYMFTVWQKLVYAAGQSFSIPDCSNQQLLNLAEIRMTTLLPGTKTIINGVLTASGDGDCVITTADSLTYDSGIFYPIKDYTVPMGTSLAVILASADTAPYIVPSNALSFDTEPTNFGSLTTENSTPGRGQETVPELRKRLQTVDRSIASIDLCTEALQKLVGIQSAAVFFNSSLSENLVIGSASIPPRDAYILVQGSSDNIAEVYCTYMNAPATQGLSSQDYTTLSGQIIPVHFAQAAAKVIYIKVFVNTTSVPITYQDEIKDMLLAQSGVLGIGVDYTQKYLLNLFDDYTVVNILGLSLSDDGVTWSHSTNIDKYQIGVFAADNISFEVVS